MLATAAGPAGAGPPPGFDDTVYLTMPTGTAAQFAWTPDGELFVGEKAGKIWHYDGTTLANVLSLSVSTAAERGVNGIAPDPDYLTNGRVWIYYTHRPEFFNRLSRFTFDGGALVDEVVVLDGPLVANDYHNAGDFEFAADKTLFVAMGDDGQGSVTAQDPFDLRGKILHIDRDGAGVPGNPFFDGTAGDPRVWAMGLRNPYRISLQPGTDNVFIGDVGLTRWEEIDLAYAGANMGWGDVEGPEPAGVAGYVYPIHVDFHSSAGGSPSRAIIAGDFAEPGDLTPEYEGDYFFTDHKTWKIHRMVLDESNAPVSVEEWATDVFWPTELEFGPDGALYYVVLEPGTALHTIHRIGVTPGPNRQPIAGIAALPDHGAAPLAVTLDGSLSSDPDDDPLTHLWDTGDGTSVPSAVANHSYPQGVYHAKLTVEDGNGGSDVSHLVRIVSGNQRPAASISTPSGGATFAGGAEIAYAGGATDAEDGAVPCSAFAWHVVLHRDGEAYPAQGPLQGSCSGAFVATRRGFTSTDAWYEVFLTASDSGAPIGAGGVLTGRDSIVLLPETADLQFTTVPIPDLEITLDGQALAAPATVPAIVGTVREVGTPGPQLRGDGHRYRWVSWSDGGPEQHEITTIVGSPPYEATFGCDVLVEVESLAVAKAPGGAALLTWEPASDDCLVTGDERYRVYVASTPRPSTPPGTFPADPQWTLAATSATESHEHPADPADAYFLVVGAGTDGLDGPVGHYGE